MPDFRMHSENPPLAECAWRSAGVLGGTAGREVGCEVVMDSIRRSSWWCPRWIVPAGLSLLLLLIYGRSLGNDFVNWDDGLLITENAVVRSFTPQSVYRAFTMYDPELYIPLTFLSYQLNYLVAGYHPFVYHITNLALHATNTLLVLWLVTLWSGKRWVAAVTALLFAVHPLHVETVVWASARKDLLATLFFLLTLCAYCRFRETGLRRWYVWSLLCFLLGLLAKVVVIMAPLVLLLLDWREGRKIGRASLLENIPYFILSVVFGVIAVFGKAAAPALLVEKLLIGSKAAVFTLQKLALPVGLSVLYPYTQPITLTTPDLFLPLLIVLALCAVSLMLCRRWGALGFTWAFFLLMLLPSFNNIAKGQDLLRDVYFSSDRYAYVPSISILFLVALLLERLRARWRLAVGAFLVVIILLFSGLAYRQSLVWRGTETLFQNVLRHYPSAHVAHSNIAGMLYRDGQIEAAFEEYGKSIAIRPNAAAYYNLGQIYAEAGMVKRAIEAYRKALDVRPGDADARVNLGVLLLRMGLARDAAKELEEAVRIHPDLAIAHFNLGLAYEALGEDARALRSFQRTIELDPSDTEAAAKIR